MQQLQTRNANRALDLRRDVPRSGREGLAGFAWLGRMADKARAKKAGMLGDYLSLCPLDKGFLARTGIADDMFLELIAQGMTDEELGSYFERHVGVKQRDDANHWVLLDMAEHLNALDREERRAA
jgi:uncharacterized protein DUF5069